MMQKMTSKPRRLAVVLVGVLAALGMARGVQACTVPVFRYALERWPPDVHPVQVLPGAAPDGTGFYARMNANLWVETAETGQVAEVVVRYADGEAAWYEGPWRTGLIQELVDSPLRRRIAHELVTGTAAVLILVESPDAAANAAAADMLEAVVADMERGLVIPEQPSYDDGLAMRRSPSPEDSLSPVPLRVEFTLYRLRYEDPVEAILRRQIMKSDPALAGAAGPVLAVVFGRGRMIPMAGDDLTADAVNGLGLFLCGACSCQVKAMNPGIDLLMAANWDEAIYAYPEPGVTAIGEGNTFRLGGTGEVEVAVSPGDAAATCAALPYAETCCGPTCRPILRLVAVLAVIVAAGTALLRLRRRPNSRSRRG
jgi:hypothetical protein